MDLRNKLFNGFRELKITGKTVFNNEEYFESLDFFMDLMEYYRLQPYHCATNCYTFLSTKYVYQYMLNKPLWKIFQNERFNPYFMGNQFIIDESDFTMIASPYLVQLDTLDDLERFSKKEEYEILSLLIENDHPDVDLYKKDSIEKLFEGKDLPELKAAIQSVRDFITNDPVHNHLDFKVYNLLFNPYSDKIILWDVIFND